MPRPPHFNPSVTAMPGAVYSPFAHRLADHPGPVYPLHVGDTWLEPGEGMRMQDIASADHPGLHQYCDTQGLPDLIDALVERTRQRSGLPWERESVLVTAGATAGLGCAVGALAAPGDEVLILAPFWPLIRGIVQAAGATPVEVPFYDRVNSAAEAVAAVRDRATEGTVALYISTPSNPTGRVLPETWLEALTELARDRGWWILADEVYEDFVYHGEHVPLAPLAPERTVTAYSFSKAYGMAGNRVGYLVGPAKIIEQAQKLGTHSFYNAPVPSQVAALRALEGGGAWQRVARDQYRTVGEAAGALLGLPAPEGSTFLFVNVADALDRRGLPGLLEDCFEEGVLVAPGSSSGRDYAEWVRVCYTGMPPEPVLEGVGKLAKRLARR